LSVATVSVSAWREGVLARESPSRSTAVAHQHRALDTGHRALEASQR